AAVERSTQGPIGVSLFSGGGCGGEIDEWNRRRAGGESPPLGPTVRLPLVIRLFAAGPRGESTLRGLQSIGQLTCHSPRRVRLAPCTSRLVAATSACRFLAAGMGIIASAKNHHASWHGRCFLWPENTRM